MAVPRKPATFTGNSPLAPLMAQYIQEKAKNQTLTVRHIIVNKRLGTDARSRTRTRSPRKRRAAVVTRGGTAEGLKP